ncbi:MAG: hemolysin family protein [Clostridia bacterium]|nr:hemolysin family protein [Clostridia bacterium]
MIGASLCAASETAYTSANRIRLMSLADDGDPKAKRALRVIHNFDKALTTLLILNNITHIATASIATIMVTKLWGAGAVAYSTIVTTVVVFLFAEMIPKYFAKTFSDQYAMAAAGPMLFLMKVLTPVSFFFTKIADAVKRPFKKQEEEPTVTEDELYGYVEAIAQEGVLNEDEAELVQSALEFGERTAGDIVVPWDKVLTVSSLMSQEEILEVIRSNIHSRLPVMDINGNVMGILHIRAYLRAYINAQDDEQLQLRAIMDDVTFVNSDTPIDELLPEMSRKRTHISIVVDGDGNNLGILTVEDILEELVGEIYDEDDPLPEGGAHA